MHEFVYMRTGMMTRRITWILLLLFLTVSARAQLPEPVGWWTFNADGGDVVADKAQQRDGTAYGNPNWIKGQWGNALAFDGVDDYAELPIGSLLSTMGDITVALWVDFAQNGGAWERIWDFGSNPTVNWFLTPSMSTGGAMRVAITTGGNSHESTVTAPSILPRGWHHVAVTIEQATMTMRLILDGQMVAEGPTHLLPKDLPVTSQDWLGRSQYIADSYFEGSLDDLRIYGEALSPEEIASVMVDSSGDVEILAPEPADESTDVPLEDVVLRWPVVPQTVFYILYFGTSQDDVEAATLNDPRGVLADPQVPQNSYQLDTLTKKQTYYWRVDTLTSDSPDIMRGEVWNFTTSVYLTLDDFESYTDDLEAGEAIFQTWIDGWGDPYNGAWVGYMESPFAEQNIVYKGQQAMLLWYDNIDGFAWADMSWTDYWDWLIQLGYEEPDAIVSETTRFFDPPMDWIDVNSPYHYLVLYVRGDTTNTGGRLYAKVNDAIVWHPDPNVLTKPLWDQWVIDFNDLATDLNDVESLTIGIEGLDYGVMYVDDITVRQNPPDSIEPQNPGTKDLAAYYSMDNNVLDQSGAGLDGQISGNPVYVSGIKGKALSFDGSGDYITLPIGEVISQSQNMTVATWVNFSGQGGSWQRIFDFGSSTSINMFLTPRSGGGPMRFAIRTTSVGEQQLTAQETLPTGWHHVAVVIRGSAGTMLMYLDGQKVAEGLTVLAPSDMGITTQNLLGHSQYPVDPDFNGVLDDFRIYTRGLTELEVLYLAGGE